MIAAAMAMAFSARPDPFDDLRTRWRELLTQGTNSHLPLYERWLEEVNSKGNSYLNSMNVSPDRPYLWSAYTNLATDSSDITGTFVRLRALALAYTVPGAELQGSSTLLSRITNGLDWMTRFYNSTGAVYDNWFDFEIAAPLALNDTVVLLYSNLAPAHVNNYMGAIEHFAPAPDYTVLSSPVTAANKVWKSLVVTLRGVIMRDASKLNLGVGALSDVFPFVTRGDGFYADGSFVFHNEFAYNTGYGVELIDTAAALMQLTQGSPWQVTDPASTNLFRWIYDAFQPFLVRGAAMEMVSGRYYTRNGDNHQRGHQLLGAILRVAQVAPPADAAAYKAFVKAQIQSDTYRKFLQDELPPYSFWASEALNDTNIVVPTPGPSHRQFPGMDRIVHATPDWTFGLSMSSSRIANYESTRSENLRGWFTGEGMTYLYNNDLAHYADNFWATINPYRLPGTTVDTIVRTNGSGDSYRSPNNQVGGASILGLYGVAAMHLNAYGAGTVSARNSWFMFDDEIVCLGNSLSSTNGRETIVENRRLGLYGNNPFTADGHLKPGMPGWSETLTNTSWAHLAGTSPGADIGYYFPLPTTIKAGRESRSGRFYEINTTYGSTAPSTANYLTLYLDHGSNATPATYQYVLLPSLSAARVAAYAAAPDITVVQNNNFSTAVRENTLGITAANFWRDSSSTVAGITCDHKASVILRNNGSVVDFGISDPTQTNAAGINIQLSTGAASILSVDPGLSVLQLSPGIRIFANTSNKLGATLRATFLLTTNGQRPTVMLSTASDANRDAPATVTLRADSRDADGTIARVDIYSATTRVAQVFAPAAETHVSLTNLLPGAYDFTAVAMDNFGMTATSATVRVAVHIPRAAGVGTGLIGEYYRDAGEFRSLNLTRTDATVNFSWPTRNSRPISGDHFCVRWFGKLQAQRSGMHQFHSQTDEAVRLWIDGRLLIDNWNNHPRAVADDVAGMSLVAGRYYDIRMEFFEDSEPGVARLYWTQPGQPEEIIPQSQLYPAHPGLRGTYYAGTSLSGSPQWVRIDDAINFSWGTNAPEPTILSVPFGARWTGKVRANAGGAYMFFTVSDDAVRLYVNGQMLVNNWIPHPLTENSNSITLAAGHYYDLMMEYYNASNAGTAVLLWQPPGETKGAIPSANLTPHQNNNPPLLAALPNASVERNRLLTFTAGASDPDGQALVYSLDPGAPSGAFINPTNGMFSWLVSSTQALGNYNITVRVNDAGFPAMCDVQGFTVVVHPGPCEGVKGDVVSSSAANPVTVADWVQIGSFAARLADPTNECQRSKADCSPAPCGDGPGPNEKITVGDWVRAGLYAAALNIPPLVSSCAPALEPSAAEVPAAIPLRNISLANTALIATATNCLSCVLEAQGDEGGLSFSIAFDTDLLDLVSASRGADAANAPHFLVNTQLVGAGRVGITFLLEPGTSLAAGKRTVAALCFRAKSVVAHVSTRLTFLNEPIACEISDRFGNRLPATFTGAEATVGSYVRFASITQSADGQLRIRLAGPAGVWDLQRSTNLLEWKTIQQLTNTTGEFEYSEMPAAEQQFYRAVKR